MVALAEGFHRVHERVFAVKEAGAAVECLYWKGRLTGLLDRPPLTWSLTNITPRSAPVHAHRAAYFADQGRSDVPVYMGSTLTPGMEMDGPAIVEEPTTTIVLYPQSHAKVTALGNYLVSISQ